MRKKRALKLTTARTWCQLRIFTKQRPVGDAYLEVLGDLLRPLIARYPVTPFFFTRYGPMLEHEDRADTRFELLPPEFLVDEGQGKRHLSVRLRIAPRKREEDFVRQLLNARRDVFWYDEEKAFIEFKTESFAEPHVYAGSSGSSKVERAEIVAQLLCWNSRLVLHALARKNGSSKWTFEDNASVPGVRSSFVYPLHMQANAYGFENGLPLGVPVMLANQSVELGWL